MTTQISVFDETFDAIPRVGMYRGWVTPDLFPNQPQPRLENWEPDDLVVYCGGRFAEAAYAVPAG